MRTRAKNGVGLVALLAGFIFIAPTNADTPDRHGGDANNWRANSHQSGHRFAARPDRQNRQHSRATPPRHFNAPSASHRFVNTPQRHFVAPPRVVHGFGPRYVAALPPRHQVFFHGGARFYFARGVWYRPVGARFVTVLPPIGFVVHTLPAVYTSFWVGAVPYYYANHVYYTPSPQGYVVTAPPAGSEIVEQPASNDPDSSGNIIEQPVNPSVSAAPIDQLFIYPQRGQSQEQQKQDRRQCDAWAMSQTGYDPNVAASGAMGSDGEQPADKIADYQRALSACLEGRGYTVR